MAERISQISRLYERARREVRQVTGAKPNSVCAWSVRGSIPPKFFMAVVDLGLKSDPPFIPAPSLFGYVAQDDFFFRMVDVYLRARDQVSPK